MGKFRKEDLDTPVLLLDLPSMESNLAKMAAFFADKPAKLRPHFKNVKVPALARKQVEAGAIGITCATLEEAEALVGAGIESILVANEIAGDAKIRRLVELAAQGDIISAVDNEKIAADISRVARDRKTTVGVLVDIDVGLNRCGVPPGDAGVRLAQAIVRAGLVLRGIMGYEGHLQALIPGPEKVAACHRAMQWLIDTKRRIEAAGLTVEIVSTGGTGTYAICGAYPGVTEIQAGSYLFMDTLNRGRAPEFTPALTVLATVVSKTDGKRIVVDAGSKALNLERGLPFVKDLPGATLRAMHAVHGIIELEDPSISVEVGDKIQLWAHYGDGTINLHERMYGIRDGFVERVLPIEARGKAEQTAA